MSAKPVIRRRKAQDDIVAAAAYYFTEGDASLELRFVNAVEAAVRHVAAHPASGSPRYGEQLKLAGLRCWQVKRFPFLVFYVEQADRIDVWRVLHTSRDLPEWLREAE